MCAAYFTLVPRSNQFLHRARITRNARKLGLPLGLPLRCRASRPGTRRAEFFTLAHDFDSPKPLPDTNLCVRA